MPAISQFYERLAKGQSGLFFCVNGQSRSAALCAATIAPLMPNKSPEEVCNYVHALLSITDSSAMGRAHCHPHAFIEWTWADLAAAAANRGLHVQHRDMVLLTTPGRGGTTETV